MHIELCKQALLVWDDYCKAQENLAYVETVCGTKQTIDRGLPDAAIRSVIAGKDLENIASRYREPITAMQDDDLRFPNAIQFAYYAIYNLYNRYVRSELDDDWLIVNQALSAHGNEADYGSILKAAIDRISEQ